MRNEIIKDMIRFTLLLTFGLVVGSLHAAEGRWLTDFAKAQAQAKAQNKMLLLNFTGSDWCPPCKALHKNVLIAEEFITYAKEKLVLVLVDFPQNKPQSEAQERANKELSEKFNVEGFPTVIVLSSEGKELSRQVGYDGSKAKAFVAKLKELKN